MTDTRSASEWQMRGSGVNLEPVETNRGGVATGGPDGLAVGAPRTDGRPRPSVRTRRARLRISRIDPWSVMKTSFLFSVALGIMTWVAVYVVWTLVGVSGMFEAINGVLTMLLASDQDQTAVRMEDFVNTNKVMGVTAVISVVNVVILTALGTIFAFLYNLSANILGGLELTLAED